MPNCPRCDAPCEARATTCLECGAPLDHAAEDSTRTSISRAGIRTMLTDAVPDPAAPAPGAAPDDELETINIPPGAARLTIGYDRDNDLVIPKPNISGYHAVLAAAEDALFLKDLNSTNGTFINGHRVRCAHVAVGDVIGLGSYSFVLEEELVERVRKRLKRQARTQALSPIADGRKPLVIGRDPGCDIILDAPQISRQHVRLIPLPGNAWQVEDLGSANGTFINSHGGDPITRAEIANHDVLFMGSYRFPISRIRDFTGPRHDSSLTQDRLKIPADQKIVTIGRGDDNDIVLSASQVSRHHARLIRKDGKVFIEDLGSANGTFVNGNRVGRALLEPDAQLSFGSFAVNIDLTSGKVQKSYQGDIILQSEHIIVDVFNSDKTTKRILDDISFTVYPTEFVGLMGPSGAGKTTLMMALIGYIRPTSGRTVLNQDELHSHYDRYRGAIGYVPQEDIIHGELSVYEALYYTAKLRLPPDTTDEEIDRRITDVLEALEIEKTRDVQIGSPEQKGISGGQRKRVNLAMELLTEPSLLCLDEPTSGLASEDAMNVMRLLRKLADGGRTILLTIHQPSLQVYRLMDNILYLADGEQIYYGPTYPDSALYFHPEVRPESPQAEAILADPGACLTPVVEAQRAGEPMETFAARYRQSVYYKEYVEDRRRDQSEVNLTSPTPAENPTRFQWTQLVTLCRRYLAIKIKDRVGTGILLIQAPVIATLIALVFGRLDAGVMSRLKYMPFALFLLIISAIWFGCSNAAREIVSEQAIFRRERMVNLSIAAYVGSKFSVLGGISFIQCVLLLLIAYPSLDLLGSPLLHLAILWTCALAGVGMGLVLSALVRTAPAALGLVPLLLIPQVVLGGAIMPIDRMQDPTWTLSHTMVSRWAFEATLQNEHTHNAYELAPEDLPKPIGPGLPAPPAPPNPLDYFIGDNAQVGTPIDLAALTLFTLLLILATTTILHRKDSL